MYLVGILWIPDHPRVRRCGMTLESQATYFAHFECQFLIGHPLRGLYVVGV